MIQVTPAVAIGDDEFTERMVKASGPGGQHVNKTSNAVELRFDVGTSSLADDVKERLRRLAGSRLSQEDVLILFSQGSRSLEMNRQEARERLAELGDATAAALDAGFVRFRPVLMTALAMIIGMTPMALGLGEGGEQNAPLGRAVIGGLIFATIATLIFVPVVFSVVHRKHGKVAVPGKDAHGVPHVA